MLQNAPDLAELYQINDILPRFLLHNAQNITIRGSSGALIFVGLTVEKFCGIFFYIYLIEINKFVFTSLCGKNAQNMLMCIYRVLNSIFI